MSSTAVAAIPSRVRIAASSIARDGVRFQINTFASEGLTARWAATSHGAILPAPTTSRVLGAGGARSLAPSAESAAVRQ
jgi:hypothetical protein